MKSVPYEIEFTIRSSPAILFGFLTTPAGLSQWFSDSCDVTEGIYTFTWSGDHEDAEFVESIDDQSVTYKWVDGEEHEYFKFSIEKSEISNDTILIITDFAEEDDIDDQELLWENQINKLKQQIGG